MLNRCHAKLRDVSDTLPPRPAPIPPPDRHQIERLNALYNLTAFSPQSNWRRRLVRHIDFLLSRILFRQREFNAALVDHLNRNSVVGLEAHEASARAIEWMDHRLAGAMDELRRYEQALVARDRRGETAVASLAASHEELRASLGVQIGRASCRERV